MTPGDGSLTVSWTAPTDTGASEVTGYDVRHIRSDATDKSDANWTLVEDVGAAAARSYTISSLAKWCAPRCAGFGPRTAAAPGNGR